MFAFRLQQLQKTEQMFKKRNKKKKERIWSHFYFGTHVFVLVIIFMCVCASVFIVFMCCIHKCTMQRNTKRNARNLYNQRNSATLVYLTRNLEIRMVKNVTLNKTIEYKRISKPFLLSTLITHMQIFTLRESYSSKLLQNSTEIRQTWPQQCHF